MTETQQPDGGSKRNSQSHDSHHHHLLPGQPFGYGVVADDSEPISDNLYMSLISILTCPLFGPIATTYALRARVRLRDGKRHEARQNAMWSRRFSFSGLVIGILFWIFFLFVFVIKTPWH